MSERDTDSYTGHTKSDRAGLVVATLHRPGELFLLFFEGALMGHLAFSQARDQSRITVLTKSARACYEHSITDITISYYFPLQILWRTPWFLSGLVPKS